MIAAAPSCPLCDASMIRFVSNGRWQGDFWGCARYRETGCTGKINIETEPAPAPLAGASAHARYERERARRNAMLRALLPAIGVSTLVLMAVAFFPLLTVHPVLAGVGAAAVGMFSAYVIWRLPSESLLWDKGARGERKTSEHLGPLIDRGFVILHDRRIPGGRGNIDHIAIGPSGVFVIETKNLSGVVEVSHDTLFVSDFDRQWYVDQVYREAVTVQIALSDVLNPLRMTVTPVLCIHNARVRPFDRAVAGVRLVSGPQLRKLAESGPVLLTDEQVQQVASVADKRLRPMYSWEHWSPGAECRLHAK